MRKPLGPVKIVLLKGNRKEHLAECDESGTPLTTTLCKKQYDAIYRTGNKPYHAPNSKTCEPCVHSLRMRKDGSLHWRISDPKDLKIHFRGEAWKPVCGQDCAGDSTDNIDDVTCQKRLDWFSKEGENSR